MIKMEIKRDKVGKYFLRASGPTVTVKEVEVYHDLENSDHEKDLWGYVAGSSNRRLAVPASELSWLSDGDWQEINYNLVEI